MISKRVVMTASLERHLLQLGVTREDVARAIHAEGPSSFCSLGDGWRFVTGQGANGVKFKACFTEQGDVARVVAVVIVVVVVVY